MYIKSTCANVLLGILYNVMSAVSGGSPEKTSSCFSNREDLIKQKGCGLPNEACSH